VSRLVVSEALKLRTTRTFWAITLAALGLIALIGVLTLALSDPKPGEDVRSLLSNSGIVGLFVLLLGTIGMTGEYRHGTITSTFLAAPVRSRVLIAKVLAYFLAGVVVGIASAALNVGLVLAWRGLSGDGVGVPAGDIAGMVLGSIVYAGLAAGIGLAVGGLLRNQIAAVCLVVAVLFIVDPVLTGLVEAYGKWSLSGLGMSLSGGIEGTDGNPSDLFAPGVAGLVLLGYVAVFSGVASALLARRDVL
jgi:ABC-2 type transport system permease protein